MKKRTIMGIGITIFLISSAIYASYNSCGGFFALKLNEQGDFLAGYIAPLALVWLVVGYLQQGEELEENTKALVAQKEEFEKQNKSIKKQLFENTFFSLLKQHNDITESIQFVTEEKTLQGREAIIQTLLVYIVQLHREYNPYILTDTQFENADGTKIVEDVMSIYTLETPCSIERLNSQYIDFHRKYQSKIGHYFRNLFLILKFIDQSDLKTKKEKKFYSNFLRAQLSSDELLFLFYNCASNLGNEQFKPLVERYAFFEHLPMYPCLKGLESIFSVEAFGKSPEWSGFFKDNKRLTKTVKATFTKRSFLSKISSFFGS